MSATWLLAFVFNFLTYNYLCLKAIPERARVTFYNKSYIEDTPIFNVRRYSRKAEYICNIIFTNKVPLDNTVKVDVLFYEYLHNEFRRSFPEFSFKLCDLVHVDPYVGRSLRDSGLNMCPILPDKHSITNLTFNHRFPSVWPFEKGMAEVVVKFGSTKALVAKGELVLTFKQDISSKAKL